MGIRITACPTKVSLAVVAVPEKAIAPTMLVSSPEDAEENSIALTTWAPSAMPLVQEQEPVPEILEVSKRPRQSSGLFFHCSISLTHTPYYVHEPR